MAIDHAPSPTPEYLLPRIARGEVGAVQECMDRYGALVWSLVRKAVRDHAQAEDAVQEVFIAIWKAADRFDPSRGTESLYITTIARRRLIDRYRRQARDPEFESIDEVVVAEQDRGLEGVEAEDEAERARAALQRLRPKDKRLVEMWVVGGMTHREIATSTGLPLGTVKSQIRRGILRVRELLEMGRLGPPTEVTA